VQSLSIFTSGIPAEYGRKMGGVVEVNTLQDPQAGFHSTIVVSAGSFDSADAFAQGQYVCGKNTFGPSASGSMTNHYSTEAHTGCGFLQQVPLQTVLLQHTISRIQHLLGPCGRCNNAC